MTAHEDFEDAIRHIAAGVSARTGTEFFELLVQHLAALFHADYAFVGLVDRHKPDTVTTIAVCAGGKIVPNMVYDLKGTPCANVYGHMTCSYPTGVQRLFPRDTLLVEMGVDGYIGTPLFDTHGEPIGLIVVLSKRPLERVELLREILEIFAARTAAEIRRMNAERELEAHRAELEARVRERTLQLEAANRELEAFAYSVSHDLRAPLRAIDGFSHALVEDFADLLPEPAREYVTRVRAAAWRMGLLIDDLLKLSRLSRTEMRRETVNLSRLAHDIAAELQRADPGRAAEVMIAPHLSTTGDPELLRVVLQNLLDNAWKYTRRKSLARIEFGVTREEGAPCFFVRDNGAGFDMRYADKLFAPFQRLHGAHEFEGTGVGLATVARIVHRHGGRIWAEAAVDRGATFYFTLPA